MSEDRQPVSSTPPTTVWHHWLSSVAARGPRPPGSASPADPEPRDEPPPPAREEAGEPIASVAWEKIWLATQRRPWRSLAVIPAGGGASTIEVANALADVGSCHLGLAVPVIDATGITLSRLETFLAELRARRGIIAFGPVLESPAGLALARSADAAILCLALGESSISSAQQTIEEVGRERFLGSVLLRS
jgi:hypothetical protein